MADQDQCMNKDNNFSSPEGISLKEYINDRLDNLEKSIDTRFESVERTTAAALAAADKATIKAETATEKRFEGVNEFRLALTDATSKNILRTEFDLVVDRLGQDIKNLEVARADMVTRSTYIEAQKALQAQVDELRLSRANLEGRASQSSVWIAYLFSAIGIIMGVIGLLR